VNRGFGDRQKKLYNYDTSDGILSNKLNRAAIYQAPHFSDISPVLCHFTSKTSRIIGAGANVNNIIPADIAPQYSDGTALASNDEIGVFNAAGLCCGAIVWEEQNAALTAWADDTQTDSLDGFLFDDVFHVKVWNHSTDEEYSAFVNSTLSDYIKLTFHCHFDMLFCLYFQYIRRGFRHFASLQPE
jgi:hypothetical protein